MHEKLANILIILLALLVVSCSKNSNFSIKQIGEFQIVKYKTGNFNSAVAISDSLLYIKNWQVAHTVFDSTDSISKLWIKGKLVNTPSKKSHKFEYLTLQEFINQKQNSVNSKNFTGSIKPSSTNNLRNAVTKNKLLVQLYYEEGQNILSISDNINTVKTIIENQDIVGPAKLRLSDITGDGIEEVFVFIPVTDYWDGERYDVILYQIN